MFEEIMNDMNNLVEILTGLASGLVSHPADLKTTDYQPTKRSLVVSFQAHTADTGKLIGDNGQMVAALREIARHMGNTIGLKVKVDILEPVVGKKEWGGGYVHNPDYKIDTELKLLESVGKFIFGESAKVQYHADSGEKTTLILLIEDSQFDVESQLDEALDCCFRATGMARGWKLAVELDTL